MRRLRFRKIWVMLAILLCVGGVFNLRGKVQKEVDASAVNPSETTTEVDASSGQYKMWFITSGGGDVPFEDTDGEENVQWNMKVTGSNDFTLPNTGTITARLSIDGKVKADLTEVVDSLVWSYTITGADGQESSIIQIDLADKNQSLAGIGDNTELALLLNPKTAGLVSVNFHVVGTRNGGAEVINISRTMTIGSPLQIYSYPQTQPRTYTSFSRDHNDKSASEKKLIETVFANNNAKLTACRIYWFFVDAKGNYVSTAPTWINLEEPTYKPDDNLAGESNIASVSEPGATGVKNMVPVYEYTVTPGTEGGFTRMVGRIYLGGDSTSSKYVECTYDVVNAADFKEGQLTDETSRVLEMRYGDTKDFRVLANDRKGTLGWASYSEWNAANYEGTKEGDIVVINSEGITAQNYGTVTLAATALFEGWENFRHVVKDATDTIQVKVAADVLKGTSSKEIIDYASEVITVGGTIQLSTNVVGNYDYKWYFHDGVQWVQLTSSTDPEIFSASGVTSASGYSSVILTGKKSGRVEMKCEVKGGTETIEKQFVVKVVDTMTLSETRKSIAVGNSFEIQAFISAANVGNSVTWKVEEGWEDYISIESTGRTSALVTGLASTNNTPVRCTATYEINGTTVSADFYVTVIPAINGAHIVATPSSTISVGGSSTLDLILDTEGTSFTEDQIKWVLKDVEGQPIADLILEKTDDPGDILKTKVKGLQVGEAYVAAVTNDEAQTEIAVITIKVVSEVTGLTLNEHEVKGYLPGSFILIATPQPEGYTDAENLGIEWSTTNENIATVTPDPDNPLKAVVEYIEIGTVRITANVSGLPAAADFCTFVIENAAESITLDKTEVKLRVGEIVSITPTLIPENVTDPTVTWSSQNEEIATVSQAGVITGVAPGTTFVTCTTSNGLMAQCIVTVLNPVEGIELNYTELTVKKGTVFFLSAYVLPEDANDRTVTWSSSEESVCSVEEDGTVTANSTGTCVITATSNDDPSITATCYVTVIESVTGITLNYKEKTIDPEETFVLKATVHPSDANDKGVTFTSSNPAVATVTEDGLVTGVSGGTAIIIVKTNDRGLIATCTVTVQQDITGITFDVTDMYLPKGEDKKINYTLTPADATIRDLEWTSSDPSIAIVDSEGYVHGVSLGEVTITATSKDGTKVSATCKVTVINPVMQITLSETALTLMEGDEHTLTYTISPQNASITEVTWTSSDVSVATVNGLGVVKALKEGETRVRVSATDGSGVYAECIVVVRPYIPITSIRLNSTETTMIVGDTRTLTDRTYPNNTTERAEWRSSDTGIVTVDENGNIRAVGPGTCTVSKLGITSGVEGICTIHVLGLTATEITLEKYDTFDLYLDDTQNTIRWFSRDKRTATVSNSGLVTARRAGTTYIVADLNGKLVSCRVTVLDLDKTRTEDIINAAANTAAVTP